MAHLCLLTGALESKEVVVLVACIDLCTSTVFWEGGVHWDCTLTLFRKCGAVVFAFGEMEAHVLVLLITNAISLLP